MFIKKKAQFSLRKQIFFMIMGIVITMLLFGAFFMMNKYKNDLTKYPDELKGTIIYKRFVNNPDCFAYQNQISDHIFTNTIDLSKFNSDQLLFCYNLSEELGYKQYNFKMELYNSGKNLKTNNYYNRTHFTSYYDVILYDNGSLIKDQLILYVQKEI